MKNTPAKLESLAKDISGGNGEITPGSLVEAAKALREAATVVAKFQLLPTGTLKGFICGTCAYQNGGTQAPDVVSRHYCGNCGKRAFVALAEEYGIKPVGAVPQPTDDVAG